MKKIFIVFLVLVLLGVVFWIAQKKYPLYNINMKIESSAFKNGGNIPSKYTCDGEGINPPISFSNVPEKTKSLVLLMDDPDAPSGTWDHWVVFNMPPDTKGIGENSTPSGIVGKNTREQNKYGSPCPPDREHRYFFKLYALDIILSLDNNATKQNVLDAMQRHILSEAELIGRYNRK